MENSQRDGNTRPPYLSPEKQTCMWVKKQQLEQNMEQPTGSKLGKEYDKAVYHHPAYLMFMQSTSCEMLGWKTHKLESRLPGRNSNNLRYTDDITLIVPPQEEEREPSDEVKEESEGASLKLNIHKTKIMASGSITSQQTEGVKSETAIDFIFVGFKITADSDCSHEIKRCLLPGKNVMTNLDSILKSRDSTLLKKVCVVKAMVFPVAMYRCESWTVKKGECLRIDAVELW